MKTIHRPSLPVVFPHPGEVHFTILPAILETIPGTCAAFTFYHRPTGTAALRHAILPFQGSSAKPDSHCGTFKYLDRAAGYLLRRFQPAGLPVAELGIKLFGGTNTIDELPEKSGRLPAVGEQNLIMARRLITQIGWVLTAEDAGGCQGRKIRFDTRTGDVFLRRLRQPRNQAGGSLPVRGKE